MKELEKRVRARVWFCVKFAANLVKILQTQIPGEGGMRKPQCLCYCYYYFLRKIRDFGQQ
jgi:hypothetical protein